MTTFKLHIYEEDGITRHHQLVQVGVPFPRGLCKKAGQLSLQVDNRSTPFQGVPRSYWPDGSIRWLGVYFFVDLPANAQMEVVVQLQDEASDIEHDGAVIQISDTHEQWQVDTGKARFVIEKQVFNIIDQVVVGGQALLGKPGQIVFEDENQLALQAHVSRCEFLEQGKLSALLKVEGQFCSADSHVFCHFESQLRFFAGSGNVLWDFKIHNKRPALHQGGFWDLGDPGSVYFSSLSAEFYPENFSSALLYAEPGAQALSGNIRIFQGSSGGENWQGNVHKNRFGEVPCRLKGYQCLQSNREVASGLRAAPLVSMGDNSQPIHFAIKDFWQNFPKALEIDLDTVKLDFFPLGFDKDFELQGGESKKHRSILCFSENRQQCEQALKPLVARVAIDWLQHCGAVPYCNGAEPEPKLQALIQNAVDGDNTIENKREVVDEYGWRNFGDVYADHETLGYTGKQTLVSHYNNQYDVVNGLLRQFFLSQDRRWWQLADELARHVTDIDIYKTDKDRAEYNGGLFWHTDHYIDAATSSHRCYSREHVSEHQPVGGGGPGAEHCYATGLLNHFFLTGEADSAAGVLSLAQWIAGFYEGSGAFIDGLYKFKSQYLSLFKRVFKGEKILAFRYPLNRGVGNYIKSLVDSYQLTADQSYFDKANYVIRNTLHPGENISDRGLENIEETWFYTILLQAVAVFMKEKETLEQFDEDYVYARDAFLHYARWIAENETPYLERSEILDYPNHAWVAQEIRRANILFIASLYDTPDKAGFLEKAEFFYHYCTDELEKTETKTFTRMYAVLMQNHGPREYCRNHPGIPLQGPSVDWSKQNLYYTRWSLMAEITRGFFKRLRKFSLSKEMDWLSCRSTRAATLFGRAID